MAFLNDGSFFEQFQRLQQTSEIPSAAEERTQIEEAIPPTIEKGQAFAAAASFSTEQPGYFFGTGESGTGYYLDSRTAAKVQQLRKGGSGMLKAKPIVPGLKVLGGISKKSKASGEASPAYLTEMERYRKQACTTDAGSGRPLVK